MLSDVVGEQIAHWRRERGINRETLAERCKDLGLPKMSPSVITNIESGRRVKGSPRRAVTVDELMVFAAALNVPPVMLLAPYPTEVEVELLPGKPMATADAVEWIGGSAVREIDAEGFVMWTMAEEPLLLLAAHRTEIARYDDQKWIHDRAQHRLDRANYQAKHAESDIQRRQFERVAELEKDKIDEAIRIADDAQWALAEIRDLMAEKGYPLPDLPPDIKEYVETIRSSGQPNARGRMHYAHYGAMTFGRFFIDRSRDKGRG